MRKVALIDRDGTLIEEPEDFQIDSVEKFKLLPNTIQSLKFLKNLGFELIMISNQDGLGTEGYPQAIFDQLQNLLLGVLASEGVFFDEVYLCPHFEQDDCECRKPKLGMLPFKLKQQIDRVNSVIIGDRDSDLKMAENLGVRGIKIDGDWDVVIKEIILSDVSIERKTKETEIELTLSEYSKEIQIETSSGFLSHMLDTFARYSGLGFYLKAKGDTHVDQHHLVEDVAIVLGQALNQLRIKNPNRKRFSNAVVMDESKAQLTLDFGGRSYLVETLSFKSPLLGNFPTEMISHFFKSLCDQAQMSLHVDVQGENDHHKAEILFKTLGMVLKEALVYRDATTESILSTKGSL